MRSVLMHAGLAVGLLVGGAIERDARGAESLSAAQALAQGLTFSPVQAHVDYTVPAKQDAAKCTIQPEKETKGTAWVVRDAQGAVLRRFADTNNDNTVDLWCYYLDGIEVYRDIDSNFNKKADQYRWFNTAGTRWGVDRNEDGQIDEWRTISPQEVAEQVVLAIKTADPRQRAHRFSLLLATSAELNDLGLGKPRLDQLTGLIRTAGEQFNKLAAEQREIDADSRYVDFGSAKPATVPIGTAGSTKDVTICDNATALVQTAGKHEQVFLGTLVSLGSTWKLVGPPAIGGDNQPQTAGIFFQPSSAPGTETISAAGPNEEMKKLLDRLEQLDREANGLSGEQEAKNIHDRVDALWELAKITTDRALRDQFYRQLSDVLSVAIQTNSYALASSRLQELEKQLVDSGADEQLVAHVVFQRMWAQYVVSQEQPNANAAKIQEDWLAELEKFVGKYPKSADAAEALLQLGMYQEFVGKTQEAAKWYQQLVTDFPNAGPTQKASGALNRLSSVGKVISLRGQGFDRGAIDLAAPPYRGKAVLVQYWATWSDNCKSDMVLLKEMYSKRGGGRDFEILGVCLDASPDSAQKFLAGSNFPWKHIYEAGGVDGRLADEMGVMTLPLMMLIGPDGKVAKNNIQVAELEAALAQLQKAPGENANALRRATPPR